MNAVKKLALSKLFLYRSRYAIGYSALILIFIASVVAASFYAPEGLSVQEVNNIRATNQLNLLHPSSLAVTNLPLHLLQLASFSIFGVSILSIKLPVILLSVITSFAIFFLLRRWFKSNVSILSMFIMLTTGQYIFIAQQFSSNILYVLYSAVILLFASLVFQKAKYSRIWKVLLAFSVALSLYTPYFWYINLGLLTVALIHPHTRYFILSKKSRLSWLPAIVVGLVTVAPLIYLLLTSQSFVWQVLGIDDLTWTIMPNLEALAYSFVWPEPKVIDGQIMPIIGTSGLLLTILGFASILRHGYTARFYMIATWIVLAAPLLVLGPQLIAVITVPMFILLAMGVETLINEWYSLFPRNPYARVTGLLLIIGLVGVMSISGIDRYIHGYRFLPEVARQHSVDLNLINKSLKDSEPAMLVTAESSKPLCDALTKYSSKLDRVEAAEAGPGKVYVSRDFKYQNSIPENWQLEEILVDGRSQEADRFYIYKISQQ